MVMVKFSLSILILNTPDLSVKYYDRAGPEQSIHAFMYINYMMYLNKSRKLTHAAKIPGLLMTGF
jgi:hypothetical protein